LKRSVPCARVHANQPPPPLSPALQGGYTADQAPALKNLFSTLQPHVVAFGAAGLCASPARWVGTESGFAPYPCWSTVSSISDDGAGDANGALWIPAETDFTLQNGDQWFYDEAAGVHSFAQLQDMYETSVGHNTALIIDFAPKPDGSLPPEQVAVAAALGTYVSGCYGAPIVEGSGNQSVITLMPSAAVSVDRVLVSEDLRFGQLVRAFTVTATLSDGSTATLATGSSVGNKFIAVLAQPLTVTSITLNVTALAALAPTQTPVVKSFAVFACDALAEAQRADLDARGFAQPPPSTAGERRRRGE
jgi:alpha-L-fucosidase